MTPVFASSFMVGALATIIIPLGAYVCLVLWLARSARQLRDPVPATAAMVTPTAPIGQPGSGSVAPGAGSITPAPGAVAAGPEAAAPVPAEPDPAAGAHASGSAGASDGPQPSA